MVAKKRTNLRAKIQAKSGASNTSLSSKNISKDELPADPLAFLHEHKATKREKQQTKHEKFLSKVQNSGVSTVSKSTLKRRRRKAREELLPKMQDLLTALDETTTDNDPDNNNNNNDDKQSDKLKNVKIVPSQKFISKNPKNLPNPKNKTGVKFIETQERARFGSILKDSNFKKSPFAALRENISQRLQSQ